MSSDAKQILQLVESGAITPEEGQRRLRRQSTPAAEPPRQDSAPESASTAGPAAASQTVEGQPAPIRIAVIGMAGRYAAGSAPGGLWDALVGGASGVREVPRARWDPDRFYDPDPRTPGRSNSRWGGFLDDVDAFDPLFFQLSGAEAERMDPQQRLFLEASWQALEDAGYAGGSVSGMGCGVFAGAPASDYVDDLRRTGPAADAQVLMGNDSAILAARISYLLNLRGPSIAVNTACSSSLVTVDLARQAIASGQCEMALAGGVCLFVTPSFYVSASKAGMLSPNGRCAAFDHRADGFVPGEGVGVVVLKELGAAQRDGDHIRGIVLGSDTNQDGRSNGITAPSSRAQSDLQRSVYQRAGVDPSTIGMVEAHGTGTALGDPIEVEALTRSFSEHTDHRQFCALGSVKTNLGHTGQAAGAAGLLKILLAFAHETIPPSMHFETPNERIDFARTPFYVPTAPVPWPRRPGEPRRAAVSSYGYSGTNAHMVLEEPPERSAAAHDGSPHLVLVSGQTPEARDRSLRQLREWLVSRRAGYTLAQLAFTLHTGRQHSACRAGFVAGDLDELCAEVDRRLDATDDEPPTWLSAADRAEREQQLSAELAEAGGGAAARRRVLYRAAEAYERGVILDAAALYGTDAPGRVPLPTYPFARERYWLAPQLASDSAMDGDRREAAESVDSSPAVEAGQLVAGGAGWLLELGGDVPSPAVSRGATTPGNGAPAAEAPLVGAFVFYPDPEAALVSDHVVGGRRVLAGAVTLELVRAAAARLGRPELSRMAQVRWQRPVELPADRSDAGVVISLRATEEDLDDLTVTVHTSDGAAGVDSPPAVVARLTTLAPEPVAPAPTDPEVGDGAEVLSGHECYQRFAARGFSYGPAYRVLQTVQVQGATAVGTLGPPPGSTRVTWPAVADGALQTLVGFAEDPSGNAAWVPYALEAYEVYAPVVTGEARVAATRREDGRFDIRVCDTAGRIRAAMLGLTVAQTAAADSQAAGASEPAEPLRRYVPGWRTLEREPAPGSGPALVVDLTGRQPAAAPAGVDGPVTVAAVEPSSMDSIAGYRDLVSGEAAQPAPRRVVVLFGRESASRALSALWALTAAFGADGPQSVVTIRAVFPEDDDGLAPEFAALGGFARTVRREDPRLRLSTVAVPTDSALDAHTWAWVLSGEDALELRVTPQGAQQRVFEEMPAAAPRTELPVRAGGSYLVTGGAGAFGRRLAARFAAHGANLVLVGRRAAGEVPALETIRAASADAASAEPAGQVIYESADVADEQQMRAVVARVRQRFGALHGVVHAAGVARDDWLRRKLVGGDEEVLAPKVAGAVVLDRVTAEDPLDHFLLCSSVVAVTGNAGQADYAYANAYLDAFARWRDGQRAAGFRHGATVSLALPPLVDGGLGVLRSAELGATPAGVPVASVLPVVDTALGEEATSSNQIVLSGAQAAIEAAFAGPDAPRQSRAGAASADERAAVEELLVRVLADDLRVPQSRIDPTAPFEAFGIDSVMVMRLSQRLEQEFGPLPKTLLFEHRTVRELASQLAQQYPDVATAHRGHDSAAPAAPVAPATPQNPPPNAPMVPAPIPGDGGDRARASARDHGREDDEDGIAIIGVSGRYPQAPDLESFWRNLAAGRDCISEVPPQRWSLAGFYDPDATPGTSYTKWGGFLDDVAAFDSLFFHISPKEAEMMDPQERLFLETVWHTLEDAGHTRESLGASGPTGVFVGVMYGHYQLFPPASDGRMGVSSYASIANRVSYFFDFEGPSLALDTMCSSSLTALHLACESLHRGESATAVAGGVNLSLHPQKYRQLSLTGFVSTDGRCRSFGAGGDGYVPGEGVGAVLLKPVRAARADGDTVYAVIRGSAVNHGGKTHGYTVPNPRAQGAAVTAAWRNAGIDPAEMGYVEAHGTGTALGDPIEVSALGHAFAAVGDGAAAAAADGELVPIGSVKSAIGHLESAAGIAAVTKVLLQMRYRELAPSLHADELNPNIDFSAAPVRVQRERTPWHPRAAAGGRLVAGVSSFGAGGANAHVVLTDAPESALAAGQPPPDAVGEDPSAQVIVLSARSSEELDAMAGRLADRLAPAPDAENRGAADGLCDDLLGRVATHLGLQHDDLHADDDLGDAGLDEVGRAVLDTQVCRDYGLPAETVFRADTVAAVAADLLARFPQQVGAAPGGTAPAATGAGGFRLSDIAYTLQLGREVMAHRLAFVARDRAELVTTLRACAAGETPVGVSRGDPASSAASTFDDAAGQQYLRALVDEQAFERLAALWAAGAAVDWRLLHEGPRYRVPLVGYPFARERHWLPSAVTESAPAQPSPGTAGPATAADAAPRPVDDDPAELRAAVVQQVGALVAEASGVDAARLDPHASLSDYGLESLAMRQLAQQIGERFGVEFNPAVFFDRPGIAGAAEWLVEEYESELAAVLGETTREGVGDGPAAAASSAESAPEQPSTRTQPAVVDDRTGPPAAGRSEEAGEPIAVVGMSARFPGSPDVEKFWENLRERRSLVTEVPPERWDWRTQGQDLPQPRRDALRWGAFIDDVAAFDPQFFGLSPAEAELMDPQQRVLLQSVWAAFEDAGYRVSDFAGAPVGLFVGLQFSDYQHMLHEAGLLNAQTVLGNEHAVAVNRISYLFDLRGPSEPVNTACSSALVAVHRAVESVRHGESRVAVAGGIGLNLAPYSSVADAMMGVMSPEGATRTFDRGANGFAKGEGVGVVMLKPLSAARADGDHILGTIRGTAVNHGGRATSLTAPSSEAQSEVIREAVERAAVDPATIGFVELHGTATELGDPVEFNGIRSAFRKLYRARGERLPTAPTCGLGSAKSNIGHLEPASGIAGLVKVLLALQHETLPGTVHYTEPNPYIDFDRTPFYVVDETRPWQRVVAQDGTVAPLRAGVSAFGFGGVNAHVLVEEPPAVPDRTEGAGDAVTDGGNATPRVFPFSARDRDALARMVDRFVAQLDRWLGPDASGTAAVPDVDAVASTLQHGREEFDERLAVVAGDLATLRESLQQVAAGQETVEGVFRGRTRRSGSSRSAAADAGDGAPDDDTPAAEEPWLLAEAWVGGADVDWSRVAATGDVRRVPLPTYPFAAKHYWFTPPADASPAASPAASPTVSSAQLTEQPSPERTSEAAESGDVRGEVEAILVAHLKISAAELEPETSFRDLGVDSLLSVGITQALQETFGTQVPFSVLADYPTLTELVGYLSQHSEVVQYPRAVERGGQATAESAVRAAAPAAPAGKERRQLPPEIVPLNAAGDKQTSFWVPGATGYAAALQGLSRLLGPDYPFYAFQSRGTDGYSMPQSFEEMVQHYEECIRMVQPEGPYVLGGHSFGGLIAMELAQRLHAKGETIRHLIMFDTYPATQEVFDLHNQKYDPDFMPFFMTNYLLDLHEHPERAIRPEELAHLPRSLQLPELARLAKERGGKRTSVEEIYRYLRGGLLCADVASGLYEIYPMRPYRASDVLFFRSNDGFTGADSALYWPRTDILGDYDYGQVWREYIESEVTVVDLDSDHITLLEGDSLHRAVPDVVAVLEPREAPTPGQLHRFDEGFEAVTEAGRAWCAAQLRDRGLVDPDGTPVGRATVHEKWGVSPEYERLVDALLDLLVAAGYLEQGPYLPDGGEGLRATPRLAEASSDPAEVASSESRLAADYPEVADYLPLLRRCSEALMPVVVGERDATEVLFPDGAMEMVDRVYRADPDLATGHRMLATRVRDQLGDHLRRFPHTVVQVMEVGAGTGGATADLLAAVAPYGDHVRYLYTDFGAGFVRVGEEAFGGSYPMVGFAAYDLERAPEDQGMAPYSVDVLVAANVLTATSAVVPVLRGCRRLLKPGGELLLEEPTTRQDYSTLTFGLTASLWRYSDPQWRLPGSPLLSVRGWRDALAAAGFDEPDVSGVRPGVPEADQPRAILCARVPVPADPVPADPVPADPVPADSAPTDSDRG